MTSPEAYVHYTAEVFKSDGEVTDESTTVFLRDYMSAYRLYIEAVLTVLPR
jgi:chromate reductase